jgi:hypothetical protein
MWFLKPISLEALKKKNRYYSMLLSFRDLGVNVRLFLQYEIMTLH